VARKGRPAAPGKQAEAVGQPVADLFRAKRLRPDRRQLARLAGALYLLNIVGGAFAIAFVPALLVVPGDAAATAYNVLAHEPLYRLALVAHVVILVTNVPLAAIFYDLFKVVERRLALLVASFTLVGTAVEAAGLLNQFAGLLLLGGGPYAGALPSAERQALAYLP
jgi:hypothetical protein